jgi:hypothetical protein
MAQWPALAISITKLIGIRRKRREQRMKSLLFRSTRDCVLLLVCWHKQSEEETCVHQDQLDEVGTTVTRFNPRNTIGIERRGRFLLCLTAAP